jgi:hypothetical protein
VAANMVLIRRATVKDTMNRHCEPSARIRATRWLAMTVRKKAGITPGLHLFTFPGSAPREAVRG